MIKLTPELAEACGIHAWDGYLRDDGKRRELDISGSIEEKDYYDIYVVPLFEKLFDIKIVPKIFASRGTYGFVIRDKKIIRLFHDLGFPYGSKSTVVKIPRLIMESKNSLLSSNFLRGLFDTDGCLSFQKRISGKYSKFKKTHNYYPSIKFEIVSKNLNDEITLLLQELGFRIKNYSYNPKKPNENIRYSSVMYGKDETNKFILLIGSRNPVKLSRFLVWKKTGFCQAGLTYKERLEILKNL